MLLVLMLLFPSLREGVEWKASPTICELGMKS